MQEMLKITGIRKSFSTLDVLKGVDLTVHKGEVVSLIGPSGSGKTTLLRCANFLDQALWCWTARPTIWAMCAALRCTKPAATQRLCSRITTCF